jgi:glycosyltransferase involved in cell wall biosynthesis
MPAYNEADNLEPLLEELLEVCQQCNDRFGPFEIVVVNDGSEDGTEETLRELARELEPVVGIHLRRNFGQSAAMAAGIDEACGDRIVTMDADGQNDPADVPQLLETLEGGYGCVSGWRADREDSLAKTVPSAIQTHLGRVSGFEIHDLGCTLKAYDGEAIRQVDLYGEGHRYIPAQLHKYGYDVTELKVNHRPRMNGQTKYGVRRLLRGSLDLAFNLFWNRYSTRPLHFIGGISFLCMGFGLLVGLHTLGLKYFGAQSLGSHLPRLILATSAVLFGMQLLVFGFLAEMLMKVHYRERTPYEIEQIEGEET